jgi:hypothetical protein
MAFDFQQPVLWGMRKVDLVAAIGTLVGAIVATVVAFHRIKAKRKNKMR